MTYEKVMSPFIAVYHVVLTILGTPFRILRYAYKGLLSVIQGFTKMGKSSKPSSDSVVLVDRDEARKNPDMLTTFTYIVKTGNNQTLKGIFDAKTSQEVYHFLTNEGYQVLSVEPRKAYDIDLFVSKKLKAGELSFALTQLSTYLKAGIPLIDCVRILSKQTTNRNQRKIYQDVIYELLKGENFSEALEKQNKTFPKLLVNMVKTAEKTGDLPSTLDDMAEYYTSMDQTRKQMISALTYPTVIFIFAIIVLAFILTVVVPSFVKMFAQQNAELPALTVAVINISNFFRNNYVWILLALVLILIIYRGLYTNIKGFRKMMQSTFMKMPVMGKILVYKEVTNFTKTFASLINHGVFITDTMEILQTVSNNEVYKDIIDKTLNNLEKGSRISDAFSGEWAFPIVAYEMLVTGENTGQLGLMMEKVAEHYQYLHKNAVTQVKSLVEPFIIAVLAIMVGIIIISVVVPMFGIYNTF